MKLSGVGGSAGVLKEVHLQGGVQLLMLLVRNLVPEERDTI